MGKISYPHQIVDSNVSEVFVSSYYTLFLKDNGSLWGMGDNFNGQLGLGESLLGEDIVTPTQIVEGGVSEVFVHSQNVFILKKMVLFGGWDITEAVY